MRQYWFALTFLGLLCVAQNAIAQDSVSINSISDISKKYLDNASKQASAISEKIDQKSAKLLQQLKKKEAKLKAMLAKIDSVSAKELFDGVQLKYEKLLGSVEGRVCGVEQKMTGEYLPFFDTLKGSLSFLDGYKDLLSSAQSKKLTSALDDVKLLQDKLGQADAIKAFIRERKQQLEEIVKRYTQLPGAASRILGKYQKEVFYYASQIREYKEIFRDPDKMQQAALTILNKIPAFQQFMKEHSELGGLFNLPGNYGSTAAVVGLQTRDLVQQALSSRLGSGANVSQVFGQQIQTAQAGLDQFKQKLTQLGSNSGDIDMPNFKPNNQRTKTFLQRLEYGMNIQSTKSSYYWPMTTDFGVLVGYKLDKGNSVGLGVSYKVGWGQDIHHIAVTSEGVGLRSYVDIKLKGSFFASGGFEYNYLKAFKKFQQLYTIDDWQKSGLLGITKIVSLNSKVFKKTKVQLLWDFLSYNQVPRAEPFKFRFGYNF